jgi:hypothetical protein
MFGWEVAGLAGAAFTGAAVRTGSAFMANGLAGSVFIGAGLMGSLKEPLDFGLVLGVFVVFVIDKE